MNVTAAQMVAVAELSDRTGWEVISPLSGPRQLATWLSVLEAGRSGEPYEQVLAAVMSSPAADLLAAVETVS